MTAYGMLTVAPAREGSMAEDVAAAVEALEEFRVDYETTAVGTVLESDDAGELFRAAAAAHDAVDADRVETLLKVDDKRTVEDTGRDKVEAVAAVLGREPRSDG